MAAVMDRCHCDAAQPIPALQHHTDPGLPQDNAGKEDGNPKYGTWDSTLSLLVAFFINAAILIL